MSIINEALKKARKESGGHEEWTHAVQVPFKIREKVELDPEALSKMPESITTVNAIAVKSQSPQKSFASKILSKSIFISAILTMGVLAWFYRPSDDVVLNSERSVVVSHKLTPRAVNQIEENQPVTVITHSEDDPGETKSIKDSGNEMVSEKMPQSVPHEKGKILTHKKQKANRTISGKSIASYSENGTPDRAGTHRQIEIDSDEFMSKIELTGIMMENPPQVLVNGRFLKEGDEFEGMKVFQIQEDHVTFQYHGRKIDKYIF